MEMIPRDRALVPAPPALVYCPHPLLATAGRRVFSDVFWPGETVAAYVHRVVPEIAHRPVVLALNDRTLPRAAWAHTVPRPGDLITVRAVAHGGDGAGADENKEARTLLTIAVIAASFYVPGALGFQGFGAALFQATIAVAGARLVNELYPPPEPEHDDDAGPSPTYSLTRSGNRARKHQPMPLILGRHRVYPDLDMQPYTEFDGEDMYLYQVFNFGLSDLVLTDFKIGDSALASDANTIDGEYRDVVIDESGADGAITLFPANVDTLSVGLVLPEDASWLQQTSSAGSTGLAVDIVGTLYYVQDDGDLGTLFFGMELQYRAVGDSAWSVLAEEVPVAPGIVTADDEGTVVLVNGDRTPVRRSFKVDVPAGQYEVRVRRNPRYEYSEKWVTDIYWSSLRSYQPDTNDYTGQKRVGVRIKASGQLNGAIDTCSALASARCEAWNGASWVTQATSNPAWWVRWLAQGKQIGSERAFGALLPDSRIDEQSLIDFGAWCDAKGLTFDGVFDRPMNCDEMINAVARCGRGTVSWASGKLGIVWDASGLPVTAVFGMANIVRDSFNVQYVTENLADKIVVKFINPDLGWTEDEVSVQVPGATTEDNVASVFLWGCTDKDMAGKEANLLAAAQVYRRRHVYFETDWEGFAVERGDVVALSHDVTQWGYSGRLVAGTTTHLTLDREVPFADGQLHYVGVRSPDGNYNIYDVVFNAGAHSVIDLDPGTPLPSAPDDDPDHPPWDYLWFFEPEQTPGKKVKVADYRPIDDQYVGLTCIDEVDAYYLAELDGYTYVPPGTIGARLPTLVDVEVTDTLVLQGARYGVVIAVTIDVTGEFGGMKIKAAPAGETLRDYGATTSRRFTFSAPGSGTWVIEVTAFNLRGQYGVASRQSVTYTIQGKDREPQDVTGFVVTTNAFQAVVGKWARVADVDVEGYFLRFGPRGNTTWEDATPISDAESGTTITTFSAPPGDWTFFIKARDHWGNWSTNAASYDLEVVSNFDVIAQVQQAPDWLGAKTNFVRTWDGVLVPGSQQMPARERVVNGDFSNAAITSASAIQPRQVQLIHPAFARDYDYFGGNHHLSDNGDLLLACSPAVNGAGPVALGQAWLYTRSAGTYGNPQPLTAAGVEQADSYGLSSALSLDGTTAAVGAPTYRGSVTDGGAIALFDIVDGAPVFVVLLELPTPAAGDKTGWAVSLSYTGDTLLATSPFRTGGGTERGTGHIWTRSGGTWTYTKELVMSAGSAVDFNRMGYAGLLAPNGLTAFLGAWGAGISNAGEVFRFAQSGGAWPDGETQRIRAPSPVAWDYFGFAASTVPLIFGGEPLACTLDGSELFVGAEGYDGAATNAGGVFWFRDPGTGMAHHATLVPTAHVQSNMWSGYSVRYSNGVLVSGAQDATVGGLAAVGGAFLWRINLFGGTFDQEFFWQPDWLEPASFAGYAVDVCDDGTVTVNAPDYAGDGVDRGALYVVDAHDVWQDDGAVVAENGRARADGILSVSMWRAINVDPGQVHSIGAAWEAVAADLVALKVGDTPGGSEYVNAADAAFAGASGAFSATFTAPDSGVVYVTLEAQEALEPDVYWDDVTCVDTRVWDEFVVDPWPSCTYSAVTAAGGSTFDLDFDSRARVWGDIASALGPGETAGIADPQVLIRHWKQGEAVPGVYKDWTIGDLVLRFAQFRCVLDTTQGVAKVTGFSPTVDSVEDVQKYRGVSVAVGGTTVVFDRQYHLAPFVAALNMADGTSNIPVWDQLTATGVRIRVLDSSQVDVGGDVNLEVKGV